MPEQIILKLLSIFDKPLHYLLMGLFVLAWGIFIVKSKNTIFWGGILIVLAIAGFVNNKYKESQENKKQQTELKREKDHIISVYNNLPEMEKQIIDNCINTKHRIHEEGAIDIRNPNSKAISSLVALGVGKRQHSVFTIEEKFFNWLSENKEKQEASSVD